jgi:hypothetical protein
MEIWLILDMQVVCIGLIISSLLQLEANNGMNGISLWSHVIVRKFAQRPGFQPVLSGYLSLIITPSSSNLKFWDQGKKSELIQFWLFQNLKEPAVFLTSKELWVSGRFSQYFSWFWEWWLYIYIRPNSLSFWEQWLWDQRTVQITIKGLMPFLVPAQHLLQGTKKFLFISHMSHSIFVLHYQPGIPTK